MITVFNLEKDEQGDWFPFFNSRVDLSSGEIIYDDPEENAAEFRIRSFGPFFEERRKHQKKEYKMVHNPISRSMERVGYYPDLPSDEATTENEDAWDYAITGIRNAFSSPGIPIECTRESKIKLLEIQVFLRFVNRVLQIISETGAKQKEESEENL